METAVEWLYNNLKSHFEHDGDLLESVQFSFEQAKEMEKQQIIDCCDVSYMDGYNDNGKQAEEYYNKTYNKSTI
jgi:hypothetical protein